MCLKSFFGLLGAPEPTGAIENFETQPIDLHETPTPERPPKKVHSFEDLSAGGRRRQYQEPYERSKDEEKPAADLEVEPVQVGVADVIHATSCHVTWVRCPEETFVTRRDQLGEKAEKKEDGRGRGRGRSAARGSGGRGRGRGKARGNDDCQDSDAKEAEDVVPEEHDNEAPAYEPKPKRRRAEKPPAEKEQHKHNSADKGSANTTNKSKKKVPEKKAAEQQWAEQQWTEEEWAAWAEWCEWAEGDNQTHEEPAKAPKHKEQKNAAEPSEVPEVQSKRKKTEKQKAKKGEQKDDEDNGHEAAGRGCKAPKRQRQQAQQLDLSLADERVPHKLEGFVTDLEAFTSRFESDLEFDELKAQILRSLKKWRNRECAYTTLTTYWQRPSATVRVWVNEAWKDCFHFSFAKNIAPMWLKLVLTVCCGWLLVTCLQNVVLIIAAGYQHRVQQA